MNPDWKIIYQEHDYELVQISENQYSLIFYTPHRKEKHIGSIDPERDYTDRGKALSQLRGQLFQIVISKPYDPDTDSDAMLLGEPCLLDEAIERLWEHRHSITPY